MEEKPKHRKVLIENEKYEKLLKAQKELNEIYQELKASKCKYCGVPDGIHRSDCLFIRRYC